MLFQGREGGVLRRVVLGQDMIRDGTGLYQLFCVSVSAQGGRGIDMGQEVIVGRGGRTYLRKKNPRIRVLYHRRHTRWVDGQDLGRYELRGGVHVGGTGNSEFREEEGDFPRVGTRYGGISRSSDWHFRCTSDGCEGGLDSVRKAWWFTMVARGVNQMIRGWPGRLANLFFFLRLNRL